MCTIYYRQGGRLFWIILKYQKTGYLLLLIIELAPCMYKGKSLSCHALPWCLEVLYPPFKKKSKYVNTSSWRTSTMTCNRHNQVNKNILSARLTSREWGWETGKITFGKTGDNDEGQWNVQSSSDRPAARALLWRHREPGVGDKEEIQFVL